MYVNMKTNRFFFTVMVAAVLMAGCTKEQVTPTDTPASQGLTTLKGTQWTGSYIGSWLGYYTEMDISLDFTSETEGTAFYEIYVNNSLGGTLDGHYTYSFEGSTGSITYDNGSTKTFTYSATDNTITTECKINLNSTDGQSQLFGGEVVFHKR